MELKVKEGFIMNENSSKKKDIIKNIAIVFLVIMLLLTLFSNTFRNYSLPEVTMTNPISGQIKEQARGNGVIAAGDTYNVMVNESRTIASVAVAKGDHVEAGDVIYVLEDKKSDELNTAMNELDKLETTFKTDMFKAGLSNEVITKARTGNYDSISTMQAELNELERGIEEEQININNYTNQIVVEEILQNFENNYIKASEYDDATLNAMISYEIAQMELDLSTMKLFSDDTDAQNEKQKIINETKKRLEEAKLDKALGDASNTYNTELNKTEKNNIEKLKENAENHKKDMETKRTQLYADIAAQISLEAQQDAIDKKKAEVEELSAKSIGTQITAPVAGTIASLERKSGEKTKDSKEEEATIATIIPDGQTYLLDIVVDAKQANRVKVGDIGEVSNAWAFPNMSLVVKTIKDDADNQGKKKITFTVDGDDLKIGQALTVSVGSKSNNYDIVVPNSAIRKDTNGDFVLTLVERKTPFGKRYIAARRNVSKLSSDDSSTAISGEVTTNDYIIISSTKPLQDGDEFRLKEK